VKPLSVSIIGCGRIAFEFENDPLRKKPASHYGAVKALTDHFYLESICDNNPERLSHISKVCTIPNTYISHQVLFNKQVPDIAVIASSTHSHIPIALAALKAGVHGIILEKPVSPSLAEAQTLLALQQSSCIPILVFHERRYDPLFQTARDIINGEKYGTVTSVNAKLCSASYPSGDIKSPFLQYGGGALIHDGTHMIDILQYLFPPIKSVRATLRHQVAAAATETSLQCLIQTEKDIPIYFDIDGTAEYFHFELDIFLTQGRLRLGNGIRELFINNPSHQYSGFSSLFPAPFPEVPRENPFLNAYQNLYQAVVEGHTLRSSLMDGFSALEKIYGIYHSCSKNGQAISFPLSHLRHPLANKSFFCKE